MTDYLFPMALGIASIAFIFLVKALATYYITLKAIQKWDGALPRYVGGESELLSFINVLKDKKS